MFPPGQVFILVCEIPDANMDGKNPTFSQYLPPLFTFVPTTHQAPFWYGNYDTVLKMSDREWGPEHSVQADLSDSALAPDILRPSWWSITHTIAPSSQRWNMFLHTTSLWPDVGTYMLPFDHKLIYNSHVCQQNVTTGTMKHLCSCSPGCRETFLDFTF